MRLEVTIPDQLYSQAQRLASETGVSFDRFISDAVSLRVEGEKPVRLTAEQLAIARKGQADIKSGKYLTSEQVMADLAANRLACQT